MQVGPSENRVKRHHHKSRNGCMTCKARRFKCDEGKPACLRCILASKECVYKVPQARLFPPTSSEIQTSSVPDALSPLQALAPLERRSLVYFNERAVQDFTGFTTYTETFWKSLIPRLSECEPAVRHIGKYKSRTRFKTTSQVIEDILLILSSLASLAIAIATKHEALHSSSERAEEISSFGVKHHSLALQCLTNSSGRERADILLVSCVAFILFERLSDPIGMIGRYLNYVIAGLRILDERDRKSSVVGRGSEAFNLVDDFLGPMFFQIELTLSMFCQPERLVYPHRQPPPIEIPAEFQDVETARQTLFQICACRYLLANEYREWSNSSESFIAVKSLLRRWYEAFDRYLSSKSESSPDEAKRAYFLRQQASVFVGAVLFSVREDVPTKRYRRPALVDLSTPCKIYIYVRIDNNRKVNLSAINGGIPAALRDSGSGLWPHAKRVRVDGENDFILLELSES